MARPGPVLIDNNALSEALRVGAWNALSNGLMLETVEEVAGEALTGHLRREVIDPIELRARVAVQPVEDAARVALAVRTAVYLDPGERDLWAHALTRIDGWILCGPDRSSVRAAVELGLQDRLISLEALLDSVGFRPKSALRAAYSKAWLAQAINEHRAGGRL
ncbi:hypothetical protein [uncultured Sphingomonas sp.]|uniref:hypothetical protein n=1 Tax=uncultured Sphingomonas sp. TaxID=158754 RepID=UPI0025FED91F|nr:hypothetical protein [uncultured Sphingomonas sp.]